MAVLIEADRISLSAQIMREFVALGIETELTKGEILTLINAADDWLDTDKSRYNAAIPVGIRSRASGALKAFALSRAALLRAQRGS
jgi:hypothetical protein